MKLKLVSSLAISLILLSCTGNNISLNGSPLGGSNSTTTTSSSNPSNPADTGTNNPNTDSSTTPDQAKNILGTTSTLTGGASGVIANTDLKFKSINDLSLDGKGNLIILDTNNLYKVELATGITKIIKPVSNKTPFLIPNSKFDYTSFFIDDKGSSNVGVILSSDNMNLLKAILSSNDEEVVNQSNISFDNLDIGKLSGIAKNSKGDIFIADKVGSKIYKISGGKVSLFAGGGELGITSGLADNTGKAALFRNPEKMAIDKNDNLYIADTGNHSIRKITPDAKVTTVAGDGIYGNSDNTGGLKARFNVPQGIAVDNQGNLYVADTGNHRIRRISNTGIVTTIAGNTVGFSEGTGTASAFYEPTVIASDGANILYVGDSKNLRIRKIELK